MVFQENNFTSGCHVRHIDEEATLVFLRFVDKGMNEKLLGLVARVNDGLVMQIPVQDLVICKED